MRKNIRGNSGYPFAEANLEATVLEIDLFVSDPPLTGAERGEVLEFVRLIRQYAFLEKLIQGEVRCELPMHLDVAQPAGESIDEQAERMAGEERLLLDLGTDPADQFSEVLDDRGIKVFQRTHGPESPERLTGGFHFVGELGPALLGGVVGGCPEATFILAHEYGHLVMDVDPYRSRFCRWNRVDLRNVSASPEEQRADRFARALLLPEVAVEECVADLGLGKLEGDRSSEVVERASEAFAVAPAVFWHRLGDLSLPRSPQPPRPPGTGSHRDVDPRRPTDLPERFVHLALAAYGQGILEKKELARFLRIPPRRLERFLAWCPIPRVRGPRSESEDGAVDDEED